MTDQPANLAEALALVQTQLPRIEKTKTARIQNEKANYTYSYADLAQVSAAILPILGRCGLAWMTKPTFTDEGKFVLRYALMHGASGERETGEFPIPSSGSPQAVGSGITYARRYALCAVTGVAPDQDDDDAARASQESRPTRQVRRKQQPEPAPDDRPRTTVRRQPAPPRGSQPPLPGEGPEPLKDGQLTLLGNAFTNLGITEAPDRLAYAAKAIGRDIGSATELTSAEATKVIESLLAQVPDGTPPETPSAEVDAAVLADEEDPE